MLKLQFSLFDHLGAEEAYKVVVVIVAIYTSNKHEGALEFNWSLSVLVSTIDIPAARCSTFFLKQLIYLSAVLDEKISFSCL